MNTHARAMHALQMGLAATIIAGSSAGMAFATPVSSDLVLHMDANTPGSNPGNAAGTVAGEWTPVTGADAANAGTLARSTSAVTYPKSQLAGYKSNKVNWLGNGGGGISGFSSVRT